MTDSQQTSHSGLPDDDQSRVNSLRELTARLSDGVLTAKEESRLNAMLKDDPIAQELYLDHMLIDGLLEFEFGSAEAAFSSSIMEGDTCTARRRRWWPQSLRTLVLLSAMLAIGVLAGRWFSWGVPTPKPAKSQWQPLTLVNHGFESGTPLARSMASVPRLWYGDVAEVVGPHSGITPLEGKQMLRFLKSESEPDNACELYQLVDLRPMTKAIATGQVSVDASAFFNAIAHDVRDDGYSFGVALYAYSEDPRVQKHVWPLRGKQPLSFGGRQEPSDSNLETWQHVKIRLTLPPDTTHLLAQISVIRLSPSAVENQPKFAGHFADQVSLALTTQNY